GYELQAPMSTFYILPDLGKAVTLVTHLVVREDAHVLYGFASDAERALFRSLLKVTGIGARSALSILSGITVDAFRQCVINKDLITLTKIPGIGRKTAERLLVEMADRLPQETAGTAAGSSEEANAAYGALIALGYKPTEVTRMLKSVDAASLGTEDIIREVLRQVHGSQA
ncbi:MAG: Holliday junction branch migration protein RuvA, partial [Alphaproteobacteria bacterium]|nr:Holliday junction branch migration protein RuvA [Alphaproteobacteria bacterium]